MLPSLSVMALIVVGFLGWNLYRRFGADHLQAITERRRATSRMVGRGEFVDGSRHLAVALALTPSTFFYENTDMESSLELRWVREIEYDTELATGHSVEGGQVLRIRCYSQTFEFVLPQDTVAGWSQMLPARREMAQAVAAG